MTERDRIRGFCFLMTRYGFWYRGNFLEKKDAHINKKILQLNTLETEIKSFILFVMHPGAHIPIRPPPPGPISVMKQSCSWPSSPSQYKNTEMSSIGPWSGFVLPRLYDTGKRGSGEFGYDLVHGAVDSLSLGLIEFSPYPTPFPPGLWGGSGRCALRVELLGVGLGARKVSGALVAGSVQSGMPEPLDFDGLSVGVFHRIGVERLLKREREVGVFSSTGMLSSGATAFSFLPAVHVLPVIIAPFSIFVHVVVSICVFGAPIMYSSLAVVRFLAPLLLLDSHALPIISHAGLISSLSASHEPILHPHRPSHHSRATRLQATII